LPVICVRLAFIRQNVHESWCRKSLVIEWHKNPFHESKNECTSELQAGMYCLFDEANSHLHGTETSNSEADAGRSLLAPTLSSDDVLKIVFYVFFFR